MACTHPSRSAPRPGSPIWLLRRLVLVTLAVTSATSAAHADVITVDDDGPADFADLQAAVDAAAEGDLILIRAGQYPEVLISEKGVLLAAERGELVRVNHVWISDVGPGQQVGLFGINLGWPRGGMQPLHTAWEAALELVHCEGTILWSGGDSVRQGSSDPIEFRRTRIDGGVRVRHCQDVVLQDGFVGGLVVYGQQTITGSRIGLDLLESRAALYRMRVHGAPETWGTVGNTCFEPSSEGVLLSGSLLHMGSSQARGAFGGSLDFCNGPLDGGAGLHAIDSVLTLEGSEAYGGYPGQTDCGISGFTACSGVPMVLNNSSMQDLGTAGPSLRAPNVVAAGGRHRLQFAADPGTRVWLVRGESRVFQPRPALGGVAHVVPDAAGWVDLGIAPTDGRIDRVFQVPHLQVGEGHRTVHLQVVAETPDGVLHLGEPLMLVLVEPPPGLPLSRIHVRADANAGGNGASWGTAFRSLHQALGSLNRRPWSSGEVEIWLGPGDHLSTDPLQPDVETPLDLRTGVSLVGGFLGSETSADQRPNESRSRIVSGDALGYSGYDFFGVRGRQGRFRCERIEFSFQEFARARIEGVFDVVFEDCVFRSEGGGILQLYREWTRDAPLDDEEHYETFEEFPNPITALHCRFEGVSWEQVAGTALLEACRFTNAVHSDGSLGRPPRLSIRGSNDNARGLLRLNNCLVHDLHPATGDSGMNLLSLQVGGRAELVGCTLTDWNPGPGGICRLGYAESGFTDWNLFLSNCVLQDLGLQPGQTEADYLPSIFPQRVWVDHSCLQGYSGQVWGEGNFDSDPRFLDALGPDGVPGTGDEDFRLAADSPCIDAGNQGFVPRDSLDLDGDGDLDELVSLDLGGLPRQHDVASVPDTGVGPAPVVDIGAYESQD